MAKIFVEIPNKTIFKLFNVKDTLSNFREQRLKDFNNFFFINKDGKILNKDEEKHLSVEEIIINEKKEQKDKKIIKMTKCETVKLIFPDNESKEYFFCVHEKINEFRKKNNIEKHYIFTYDGAEVDINDECDTEIEQIIEKEEIHLIRVGENFRTEKKDRNNGIEEQEEVNNNNINNNEINNNNNNDNNTLNINEVNNIYNNEVNNFNNNEVNNIYNNEVNNIYNNEVNNFNNNEVNNFNNNEVNNFNNNEVNNIYNNEVNNIYNNEVNNFNNNEVNNFNNNEVKKKKNYDNNIENEKVYSRKNCDNNIKEDENYKSNEEENNRQKEENNNLKNENDNSKNNDDLRKNGNVQGKNKDNFGKSNENKKKEIEKNLKEGEELNKKIEETKRKKEEFEKILKEEEDQLNKKIEERKRKKEEELRKRTRGISKSKISHNNERKESLNYNNVKKQIEKILYKSEQFNEKEESQCYTILVVGQTGSGKTTLLNSFINFILNVKIHDRKRYVLTNEISNDNSQSQTSDVKIYYIKSHNNYPPIKIIDTPGFGDTKGNQYDKIIAKKIGRLFINEISKINAVCLVVRFFDTKLTLNQKYIFQSIINLFGKDIAQNFIVLLTFADLGKPQVIDSLLADESFSTIKNYLKEPWYFIFNNSAIFNEDTGQMIDMYYQMGMESFEKLLKKIKNLPPKNVNASKNACIEREKMNYQIEFLTREIHNLLILIIWNRNYLHKINSLDYNRHNYNPNQSFINIPEKILTDCESNMINCHKCLCSCQKISEDSNLNSSLIFENRKCIICGCKISEHEKEKKEYKNILKEIDISNQKTLEEIKNQKLQEQKTCILNCFLKFYNLIVFTQQLQDNALLTGKGNYEDFIEMMIIDVKNQKKAGFAEKIWVLTEFKNSLNDIYKNNIQNEQNFKCYAKIELNNFLNKILPN